MLLVLDSGVHCDNERYERQRIIVRVAVIVATFGVSLEHPKGIRNESIFTSCMNNNHHPLTHTVSPA
jgi:hypothetical protein